MNGLSEYTLEALSKAYRQDRMRAAEHRRLVKIARGTDHESFWKKLVRLVKSIGPTTTQPDMEPHSEEFLYHAEMLNLSPNELRIQEQKRHLYERIAKGNALAEVEFREKLMERWRT